MKLVTNDKWTGPDKVKHFLGGTAIGLVVAMLSGNPVIGFAAGVVVAAAKEVYDAQGHGTPSLQDLIVTIAGSALGAFGLTALASFVF